MYPSAQPSGGAYWAKRWDSGHSGLNQAPRQHRDSCSRSPSFAPLLLDETHKLPTTQVPITGVRAAVCHPSGTSGLKVWYRAGAAPCAVT